MANTTTDATTADEVVSPEMDYPAHEATWRGFVAFVKYSIFALVLIAVSLYCFIEAGNSILGLILLLLVPIGIGWALVTRRRT